MQRGNACSWTVWTPPVRPLRSDTKVPASSAANTAASSANRPCEIFGRFALQELGRWSRLVICRTLSERLAAEMVGKREIRLHAHERFVTRSLHLGTKETIRRMRWLTSTTVHACGFTVISQRCLKVGQTWRHNVHSLTVTLLTRYWGLSEGACAAAGAWSDFRVSTETTFKFPLLSRT